MMTQLPLQAGTALPVLEEEGSTELLSFALTAESGTNSTLICRSHTRELFMMRQPQQPLQRPQPPDVASDDETPDGISDDDPPMANESQEDLQA